MRASVTLRSACIAFSKFVTILAKTSQFAPTHIGGTMLGSAMRKIDILQSAT